MPKLFISYRRNDSADVTRRLHGRLESEFERGSVFYDIDSIPAGVDFRKRLSGAVEQSDAMLAVIGGSWLGAVYRDGPKQGQRRLDDPDDYVRIEIEAALSLGVPVIPVLVDGTTMPAEADLPGGMKELAFRNAAEVRFGPAFNVYADQLIRSVKELIKDQQELWDGLERAKDVAARDPESGVNCARKVLQRMLREVYERRIKEPAGTRPLEKIAERLTEDWFLPKELGIDALLSKAGSNIWAKQVKTTDVERALTQLTEILKWYTEVERPDGVGQLPARSRLTHRATITSAASPTDSRLTILPKGLRPFDANDADFFLELLPGPRNHDGLPESIQFWKQRVEADDELTFTVGLIYGPSGCGKSSLMKAGLLPRLDDRVCAVYVEASADGTETRLLRTLRERRPELPSDLDLTNTLVALRSGDGTGERQKIFIVLDQFEQWLHAKVQIENTELIKALRQCDGKRLQAVVMVRDDFWLAVSRFLAALEVDLVADQNIALVDLFDPRHAKKVLTAFGRAFGELSDDLSAEQQEFLDQGIIGLAQDGRVISVRLALFADTVKTKPWTPATLKMVGGTKGVGVTFLEETFAATSANPSHRLHQKAARGVLKSLLPEEGTDIKGNMRSQQELMEASGYRDRPKDFDAVIRILDNEVRLITPTDPEGIDSHPLGSNAKTEQKFYQLTHDYLVPSLREWLNSKQRATRRGRAELRLAHRAALWKDNQESRHLPSLWEYINIRFLTEKRKLTEPQANMMRRAARFHAIRMGIAAGVLIAVALGGLAVSREIAERRRADYVEGLVEKLVSADIAKVRDIVKDIDGCRRLADPLLREQDAQAEKGSNAKLHLDLALLSVDQRKITELADLLVSPNASQSSPGTFAVVRDFLSPYSKIVPERLWKVAIDTKRETPARFQAACALATYTPQDERWGQINTFVAGHLVDLEASARRPWLEALRPAKEKLIKPLAAIFRCTAQSERARGLANEILADYAADQSGVLFCLLAEAEQFQFSILFEKLAQQKEKVVELAAVELGKTPAAQATEDQKEQLAKRQANISVALLRLGSPRHVWPKLKASPDPRVRSYIIHWVSPLGVEPPVILQWFDTEPDTTVRRALVLMLGELKGKLSVAQRHPLIEKLMAIYEMEPDAGLHGAVEWLLRELQQEKRLESLLDQLKTDDEQLRIQKATEKRQWYVNTQKQTFVIANGGEFLMGSPPSEPGRNPMEGEQPHRVRIGRRFAISAHEVTLAEYQTFQKAVKGFDLANHPQVRQFVRTPDSPQNCVKWYEAAQYCDWLSKQEKIPRDQWCYDPEGGVYGPAMKPKAKFWELTGYRLPTEAEWEFACRAGTTTSRYYGLTERLLPQYGHFLNGRDENRLWPTAQLKPNDWGLFDMLGNALEWCFDRLDDYPKQGQSIDDTPTTEPVEIVGTRVMRGGAYYNNLASSVRSANRAGSRLQDRVTLVGFRPARTCP
jgi:eukaryotic-like serine/threonine-protein kinase